MERLEIFNFCERVLFHNQTNEIEMIWADPRDIFEIKVYANGIRDENSDDIIESISYWQSTWPQNRPKQNEIEGGGKSGWTRQDDWYKGCWNLADVGISQSDIAEIINFKPLNHKEYPKETYPVLFRRTLKLKIKFSQNYNTQIHVKKIMVFTTSEVKNYEFRIHTDSNLNQNQQIQMVIEAFNGEILNHKMIFNVGESIPINGVNSNDRNSFDNTLVTVDPRHSNGLSIHDLQKFTFSLSELIDNKYIFIPDLTILITNWDENNTYDEISKAWEENKTLSDKKCVYDRIYDLEEQTYDQAWKEFENKKSFHGVIGCEGVRSKCAVKLGGQLAVPKGFIKIVKHSDTARVYWKDTYSYFDFKWKVDNTLLPESSFNPPKSRRRMNEYLPIFETQWEDPTSKVKINQIVFATLLESTNPNHLPKGDEISVAMIHLKIENPDDQKHVFSFSISPAEINTLRPFGDEMEGHRVQKSNQLYDIMEIYPLKRESTDSQMILFSDSNNKRIPYHCIIEYNSELHDILKFTQNNESNFAESLQSIEMQPHQSIKLIVKIPMLAIEGNVEKQQLQNLHFDTELQQVIKYWNNRIEKAAKIEVPNEEFTQFYKAHLTHVLITNDRDVGSDRSIGRVGATGYGCYPNEVCMISMDLDRRGMFHEAEKILDTFIYYQSTAGYDGDYEDIEGIFFGANGYERGMGYNQNQGFVLWAISEHVNLSKDYEWVSKNIEAILLACEWIVSEIEIFDENQENLLKKKPTFLRVGPWGQKKLFPGMLPPGGVEDITDYWIWLGTNVYNSFGLTKISHIFERLNHPKAKWVKEQAQNYRNAVRNNFQKSMEQSPVIKLRNGTFQPHFPCRMIRRGRGFGWIQEVLEGAIHLIRCEIFPHFTKEATWIIKDHEDNLYCSKEFGYQIPNDDFESYWFNRGGFSEQPYLLCNHVLYAIRGENKHFLRAFFNAFAISYRADTRMFTEHPLPTVFDWFGHHYKTSDEAQFMDCFRNMLLQEVNSSLEELPQQEREKLVVKMKDDYPLNALKILGTIPEEWLAKGKIIAIQNAPTYFGIVSLKLESNITVNAVKINLEIKNLNNLESCFVYLRRPDPITQIKELKLTLNSSENYIQYLNELSKTIKKTDLCLQISLPKVGNWLKIEGEIFFR
jgi:hypothetical protein